MTILAISPFLWTMRQESGVPTVSRTLEGLGRRASVHLVLPSDRTEVIHAGYLTLHLFRLAAWSRFFVFGPNRSIFSHRFPGGRIGRYVLDKLLWAQLVAQAGWTAARISRRLKPHVYYGVTPHGAAVAWLLRRLFGGVNVSRLLGTFLAPSVAFRPGGLGRLRRWLWLAPHFTEVLSFRLPAHAIVITDDGTRGAEVARQLGSANVYCWRNGVDLPAESVLARRAERRRLLLSRLGIDSDRVVGLYAGQLVAWKRVDRLIEACAILAGEDPAWVLMVAGDGPERPRLEALAARPGLEGRIRFCGAVTQAELMDYRLASDFFVCPHDLTCACNSLFEAMAAELPVVATAFGDTRAVLQNGREGLLVESGDPQDLAAALSRMIRDGAFRREAGRRARARIVNQLGAWEQRVDQEYALLDRLVKEQEAGQCRRG